VEADSRRPPGVPWICGVCLRARCLERPIHTLPETVSWRITWTQEQHKQSADSTRARPRHWSHSLAPDTWRRAARHLHGIHRHRLMACTSVPNIVCCSLPAPQSTAAFWNSNTLEPRKHSRSSEGRTLCESMAHIACRSSEAVQLQAAGRRQTVGNSIPKLKG
jgi:hypothetical protein